MEIEIQRLLTPTAVSDGEGKFHPAIMAGALRLYYWPNVKCATDLEATERAQLAIGDVYIAANSVAREWNVVKL